MSVFVISKTGERLMPTTRYGNVRHLLKEGKAKIIGRNPFTIQLCYESSTYTQPMEMCVDAGYAHVGISVKSDSKEFVSAQYDLLKDEKEHHDDAKKYRRTRRNRLRYRKPRFDNRKKPDGWFAPSIQNKADRHVDLLRRFCAAAPILRIVLEGGQFDTQLLQAIEEGKSIPEGTDYQHGDRYGEHTLREAVFQRDHYKCIFCGRSGLKDKAILHAHHVYYWRGQHGNRLSELASACELCHTPENHRPGGKLYGHGKSLPRYTGVTFMNIVKWNIFNQIKPFAPEVKLTYGAATKVARSELVLEKSHANDAYAMGEFHPEQRSETEYYTKRRRNNRVLEKFYDAKYIDTRDGKKKSGVQLGCQRTNRREPRMSSKNLRIYHGEKVSPGRKSIRKTRYKIQPGDVLLYKGQKVIAKGCQHYGQYVVLDGFKKAVSTKQCRVKSHCGGWLKTSQLNTKGGNRQFTPA